MHHWFLHLRAQVLRLHGLGQAGGAVGPEKQVGGGLVSRGKGVVLQFQRRNPAKIGHPNWTRFVGGCDGGPVEDQVNDIAIVAVGAVGCGDAHIYIDTDALPHLPLQRGLVALAWLDSAAREFPQTGQHSRRASLRDEISPLLLDHGRHYANVRCEVVQDVVSGRAAAAPKRALSTCRLQPPAHLGRPIRFRTPRLVPKM